MKWYQNRLVACIICVVIVLTSSLVRSQITFAGFYSDAESVFMNGLHADGYSIQNDCEKKVAIANNLLTISKKYLKEGSAPMQGVESKIQAFHDSTSIEQKARAMSDLDVAYDELLSVLNHSELSAKDKDYLVLLTADYDGTSDMIERNGYHEYVDFLIQSTEAFPASVFYALSNKHLMRFEGGQ